MARVGIEALVEAARPAVGTALGDGARLTLPSEPRPFIPPGLLTASEIDSESDAFAAEVVIVSSAAAVGKSTVAAYLASVGPLPLLDLASVHVSTNSLVGLVATDIAVPSNATAALHQGELTLVVDALDEGRLLSGDANFEEFLRTSWELLLRDRSVTNKPKLVLFGRDVAAELVKMTLDLYGEEISVSWLTLDFFDHDEAVAVIEAHAAATATRDGRGWSTSAPVRETISTFFTAIEIALGLEGGTLWNDRHGKAFAGYAPVLAAIGTLLASEPNPTRLKNALEEPGAGRAWEVIERVAEAILERERAEKVVPQLERAASGSPGTEAYDAHEQLTYLSQVAQQQPVSATNRVSLSGSDMETYQRMLDQHVPEHPFLEQNVLANDVLASIVLAHAVTNDLLTEQGLLVLREASRLPFLWRSLHRLFEREGSAFIDGRYVGCILNSLWSDAVVENARVLARASADYPDVAEITIEAGQEKWVFEAVHPIEFYEQLNDSDVRLEADVILQGHYGRQESPSFDVRGDVVVVVNGSLDVRASAIRIDGSARFTATALSQPANLQVSVTERTQLWWGGRFRDTHPWSQHPSSLEAPIETEPTTGLEHLLIRCAERLPAGAPLTLSRDFLPVGDRRLAWIDRDFSFEEFARLIRLLVDHKLAATQSAGAAGPTPMLRVHFAATWDRLLQALRTPQLVDPALAEAMAAVKQEF